MNREEREQIAIFKWAEMQKGISLLHHIPNGGKRGKVEAARLKAAGVKAGIPDICLPVPRNGYGALYIELKAPSDKLTGARKGVLSQKQREVIDELRKSGNAVVVCYGAEEAIKAIKEYIGA